MNIQEFINKTVKEAQEEYDRRIKVIQEKLEQLENDKQFILTDKSIPEKTDVLEVLTAHNGKAVRIKTNSSGLLNESEPLNFDPKNMRVLIEKVASCPLIGQDYIEYIYDMETKQEIYHNPYAELGDSVPVQVAKLLGRKAGLDRCEKEIEYQHLDETWVKEDFDSTVDATKQVSAYIERGSKLIYPQMQERWEECVKARVSDLYHGTELKNALDIMEALEAGKSVEEAMKLVDDGHSGNSYGVMVSIVTDFSKRGVEFGKQASDGYRYALEGGDKEEIAEWDKYFKQKEDRNAKFNEELGKGGMS